MQHVAVQVVQEFSFIFVDFFVCFPNVREKQTNKHLYIIIIMFKCYNWDLLNKTSKHWFESKSGSISNFYYQYLYNFKFNNFLKIIWVHINIKRYEYDKIYYIQDIKQQHTQNTFRIISWKDAFCCCYVLRSIR